MPNDLLTVMLYDSVEALHVQRRNQPEVIIRDVLTVGQRPENFRIDLQNGESIFVPPTTIMRIKIQETLQ